MPRCVKEGGEREAARAALGGGSMCIDESEKGICRNVMKSNGDKQGNGRKIRTSGEEEEEFDPLYIVKWILIIT